MAYQKDQFFYKKLLNIFTYKKTPMPRLARLILLEMAKHCNHEGIGEASRDEIAKALMMIKNNISRFTKGFSTLKIMTKTKQYHKGSQNMKQNKFQIHLEIVLDLSLDAHGDLHIENKPFIYQKKPVNTGENDCTNIVTSHHGDATPSHHGDAVKLINKSNTQTKQKHLDNGHDQNLTDQKLTNLPISLFEHFWAAYPRKQHRVRALKVWNQNKLDRIGEIIIRDVLARREVDVQWQEKEYIPHAATYLGGECWNDEIIEKSSSVEKNGKFDAASYLLEGVKKDYANQRGNSENIFNVSDHLAKKMER